MATVKLDIRKLKKAARSMRPDAQAMKPVFKKAALRFLTFSQRRFDRLSKGASVNGEKWQDLADSTKAARRGPRKGFKGPRKFAILVDTATLKKALLQGSPGNLIRTVSDGIEVGIGGGSGHPKGGMTIGDLAVTHHEGNDRTPARPVLTDRLDEQTRKGMTNDMAAGLKQLIKGATR